MVRFAAGAFALVSLGGVTASGQVLFSEAFDDASADVTILQQADTDVRFVDYGNLTVGSSNFSIAEAPRALAGGAATRGVLMRANIVSGAAAGINLLAGSTPISFSGNYTVSFDAFMNVPLPLPNGSTEQLLWGVGVDNAGPLEALNQSGSGTIGTWGWLTAENGSGTQDAGISMNDTELADLGDSQLGEDTFFNAAFTMPAGGINNAAANSWVEVDIVVADGSVSVFYNGVEFFSEASASTDGFAMLGYEDPFSSIGSEPDAQWAIFDNFVVVVPAPGLAGLLPLAVVAGAARRRRN